jgi:Ran GTPase-activating protein (RanGAP) involved in mRNA processing and transport
MNLSQEQLIDHDIPIIIEQAIINKQCTILDLTGNDITSEGAILLADALNNNSTLKELILYNNRIGDKGVRALALELSINNSTLKTLNLGFNDITDDGAQHLAQMLKTNRTLTHLWLQQNHIGDRGIQLLAGVLARQNWSLQFLNLFSNKFSSDLSVTALIDMLQLNQSLQKLDIDDCNLTDTSEVKLREIIKTKKDFELII